MIYSGVLHEPWTTRNLLSEGQR